MRRSTEGFAVLLVLVLLAVIGLYAAATLQDALFGEALAGTRVFQQRAFMLAELGIEDALADLAAPVPPADYTRELYPLPDSDDSTSVALRAAGSDALPAGFSAGRFIARRYEIESTGHAARGARSLQRQGVTRVLPLTEALP